MTRSIWLDSNMAAPRERVRHEVDVAIIGGGIIGTGCAHYVAQRGKKAIILEASALAAGASGRSAGFVLRGFQSYYNLAVKQHGRPIAKQVYAFTEENQSLMRQFVDQHHVDYEPCGSYLLACSLEELEDLAASAQLMKEDGFAIDYLKEDPIDRDYYGALANAGDLALDPVQMVRALSSGVQVLEGETVSRVEPDGGKLLVHSSTCTVRCERVLLALNAYAPQFDTYFTDKIIPTRGQVLVTKPLRERILDRVCYANYGWEYFRQLPDNRLLLGGCRENFVSDEIGYADMVTRPVQSALENYLKDRFPDVAGVRIDYRFSGVMGFTADGLPLVGEMRKIPGLFYAVGFNGHGFGYGLNMARLLVAHALDGHSPGIFTADRASDLVAASSIEKGP